MSSIAPSILSASRKALKIKMELIFKARTRIDRTREPRTNTGWLRTKQNLEIQGWTRTIKNLKLRTGPDQDQEKFQNLGPDRTGPDSGPTKFRKPRADSDRLVPGQNIPVQNILLQRLENPAKPQHCFMLFVHRKNKFI